MSRKFLPKALLAMSIALLAATQASADATLDRIKARGTLTVGVILSGAPFGYIDPTSQTQKGYNLDIAKALSDDLGVKLETVTVTPPEPGAISPAGQGRYPDCEHAIYRGPRQSS